VRSGRRDVAVVGKVPPDEFAATQQAARVAVRDEAVDE
jgi:hypothetical protein